MQDIFFKISKADLEAVANYVATKPWIETHALMKILMELPKAVPEFVTKEEAPKAE